MEDLIQRIEQSADKAVQLSVQRGSALDYTEASLAIVVHMLEEASEWRQDLSNDEMTALVQQFGSYILEVARKTYGGRYEWDTAREQPMLITGEPQRRISLMTWGKVRGRIAGDAADDIEFLFKGYAERVKTAAPGTNAVYV